MTDDGDAPGTSTLEAARAHARSQAPAGDQPDQIDPRPGAAGSTTLWEDRVAGGGYATHRLPHGAVLTLTDVDGDTCVALVVHRADHTAERLNVADTVKVQWQAYPDAGRCCCPTWVGSS